MVAIVVLLSGVLFTAFVGIDTEEKAPNVVFEGDSLRGYDGDCSGNCQWVNITHAEGQEVDVTELELRVELVDYGTQSRLRNLPASSTSGVDSDNYEGGNIFDLGCCGVKGPFNGDDEDWSGGEQAGFQLKQSGDGEALSPGDTVTVDIIDTESNSIIGELTFEVR